MSLPRESDLFPILCQLILWHEYDYAQYAYVGVSSHCVRVARLEAFFNVGPIMLGDQFESWCAGRDLLEIQVFYAVPKGPGDVDAFLTCFHIV